MSYALSRYGSIALLGTFGAVAGCSTEQTLVEPDFSLNRMLQQPRYDPFETSTFFRDGRAMRTPPAGTVPREKKYAGSTVPARGTKAGRYLDAIPLAITYELLARGRDRFDHFCATCHGILGDGDSPVASNMQLRKPPSLHDQEIRDDPPGRLFQIISEGYGLMPSYVTQLNVEDRWAVVGYVRALQLSQNAPAAMLPPAMQQDLMREAP